MFIFSANDHARPSIELIYNLIMKTDVQLQERLDSKQFKSGFTALLTIDYIYIYIYIYTYKPENPSNNNNNNVYCPLQS